MFSQLYSAQLILRSVDSLSAKPYRAGNCINEQKLQHGGSHGQGMSGGDKGAVPGAARRTGLVQHQLTEAFCAWNQLTCVLPSPAEVGLTRPSGVHGVRSRGTTGGVLSMVMVSTSLSDESPGA